MATLTIKAQNFCAANNHFDLVATGDVAFAARYEVGDFSRALTDDEKRIFLMMLVRFARIGRTNAQVVSALTSANGATVTV